MPTTDVRAASDTIAGGDLVTALRMLESARADGTLVVRSGGTEAFFAIHEGRILSAHSLTAVRTGDELVERGTISRETLEGALSVQRRKRVPQPLVSLLVSLGMVPDSAARDILADRCAAILGECRAWDPCALHFEPGEPEPVADQVHDGFPIDELLAR